MYSASRLRSGATSPVTTASQSEKAVGLRVRDLRLVTVQYSTVQNRTEQNSTIHYSTVWARDLRLVTSRVRCGPLSSSSSMLTQQVQTVAVKQ